jgi:hypothetical protein
LLWHNAKSALGDGHLERPLNIRSAAAAFFPKENYEKIKQSGNADCYRSTRNGRWRTIH